MSYRLDPDRPRFLWMLWDKEKQAWEDKFATSVVVPASSYPVAGS